MERARGLAPGRSGMDTQLPSSLLFHSLPEQHLPDSVVQGDPGALEEEAKIYSDRSLRDPESQAETQS